MNVGKSVIVISIEMLVRMIFWMMNLKFFVFFGIGEGWWILGVELIVKYWVIGCVY